MLHTTNMHESSNISSVWYWMFQTFYSVVFLLFILIYHLHNMTSPMFSLSGLYLFTDLLTLLSSLNLIDSLINPHLLCKGGDRVIQTREEIIATQGQTVSLQCTFMSDNTPYLFWYKQQINDFPRFVLQRSTFGGDNAEEFHKNRFDAQIQNTSVPLRIQNLQLSDSALYYCALRPTVTGNTDSPQKPAEHKSHFPLPLRSVHRHYA